MRKRWVFTIGALASVGIVTIYDFAFLMAISADFIPNTWGRSWYALVSLGLIPLALLIAAIVYASRVILGRQAECGPLYVFGCVFSLLNQLIVGCFTIFQWPGACT